MRHSKRDYLTCQDVKLAMGKLNIDSVFGYPSFAQQYSYQKMNINVGQDGEVDVSNDQATNTAIWYTKPH